MASAKVEVKGSEVQLKHLKFVRILTINAIVLVSNLYDCAKKNSGSLKSTVGSVQNAVAAVVGPVYEKFKNVPGDLLVFLDKKVDEAIYKFDECAPPFAKKAARKAQSIIKDATKVSQDLVKEAQDAGPRAAILHARTMSKHFAVSQLAVVWYKIGYYPPLHGVAEMAIPTAAQWCEKYNNLVKAMTAKGYNVFSYVPLVPVEEIAKAYKQIEASAGKKRDSNSSSESESDKEE